MRALQRRIFKIKVILKELLLQVLILLQLKFKLMLWPRYSSQTYEIKRLEIVRWNPSWDILFFKETEKYTAVYHKIAVFKSSVILLVLATLHLQTHLQTHLQ